MIQSHEKRAREEMEGDSVMVAKKTRLNSLLFNDNTNMSSDAMGTSKKFIDFHGKRQQHHHHNFSMDGAAPDNNENNDCEANDSDSEEEVTLFHGPAHPHRGVSTVSGCGLSVQHAPAPGQPSQPAAVIGGCRVPRTTGAATRLYSLQQLEELVRTAPSHAAGRPLFALPPSASALSSMMQSCASPLLRLNAGETVLFVVHHGQAEGTVLPNPSTEEFSHCRIFCLDIGELPPSEYEGNDSVICAEEDEEPGVGTSFLQLHQTDLFTSLQSQERRDMENAVGRIRDLLRLNDFLKPDDTTSSKPLFSDNSDKGRSQSLDPSQCPAQHEELTLPILVMWRTEGGPPDEYCHKGEVKNMNCNNHNITNNNNNKDNSGSKSSFMPVSGSRSHGQPLVVKHFTALDQLHSLSLLSPVYTVTHFLRTVYGQVISPENSATTVSGTRSLIYFGASWCPPCMRIVNALPAMMKEDFHSSLTCAVKADMDLATPLFEFFGVEIIPTFILFDNDVLRDAIDWGTLCSFSVSEGSMAQLHEGLRRSELGRIQNSQRLLVRTFIESHSNVLKFDEDF